MKINIKKAMLTLLAVPVLAAGVAGLVAPHVGALGSKKVLALHMEMTR